MAGVLRVENRTHSGSNTLCPPAQVIVTEGDLKQLLGRVTKVLDDGRVEMMPTMEGLDQALVFEARQLQKYFQARPHHTAGLC